MGIFDFIRRRKKKKLKKRSGERKLTDTIILEMTKYLMELQTETISTKSVSELNAEYARLERIGLGNTGNARKIKEKLDFIQKDKDSRNLGQILLDYIKSIHDIFGITTYLISVEQFYKIIREHRLDLRLLSEFTGDVSEENIKFLDSIIKKATTQNCLYLNQLSASEPGRLFFIDTIKDRRSVERNDARAFELIHEHLDLVVSYPGRYDTNNKKMDYEDVRPSNDWMLYIEYSSLVDLYGKYIDSGDLMVAAVRSCFNEENPVVQGNPIIYQVCPYGVLVHLIMGEEADQGIFEEYQNLSNDLLG
jgi:hypothetical protein